MTKEEKEVAMFSIAQVIVASYGLLFGDVDSHPVKFALYFIIFFSTLMFFKAITSFGNKETEKECTNWEYKQKYK